MSEASSSQQLWCELEQNALSPVAHTDATHLYRVDVPSTFARQAVPSASWPVPFEP